MGNMKISTSFLFISSSCMLGANAFSSLPTTQSRSTFLVKSTTAGATPVPFFLDEVATSTTKAIIAEEPTAKVEPTKTIESDTPAAPKKKKVPPKVKKPNHKEGVFSPIVFASKKVLGEENLNQLRGKVISLHSGVIGSFVDTHSTPIGSKIAQTLFVVIDENKDGTLDQKELKAAFQALGFSWLQDKQVAGIMKRADKDENGVIDYEEFGAELSKTLRTNLIKLAKKNGEAMGLLV